MTFNIFAQRFIYDSLIAFAILRLLLKPSHDIRINTQCKLLL